MKGIVVFLDKDRVKLAEKSITELDFRREAIAKECMKLFKDDNPCIMRRTFCTNKMAMEILDQLNKWYKEEVCFDADSLPWYISSKVKLPPMAKYMLVR